MTPDARGARAGLARAPKADTATLADEPNATAARHALAASGAGRWPGGRTTHGYTTMTDDLDDNERDESAPDNHEGQDLDPDGWEPFKGEHGGKGWKNTETGEVVYQDEPPGWGR